MLLLPRDRNHQAMTVADSLANVLQYSLSGIRWLTLLVHKCQMEAGLDFYEQYGITRFCSRVPVFVRQGLPTYRVKSTETAKQTSSITYFKGTDKANEQ